MEIEFKLLLEIYIILSVISLIVTAMFCSFPVLITSNAKQNQSDSYVQEEYNVITFSTTNQSNLA